MPAPYERRVGLVTTGHPKERLVTGLDLGAAIELAYDDIVAELTADTGDGFANITGQPTVEIRVDGDDLGYTSVYHMNAITINGIGGTVDATSRVRIVNTGSSYLRWTNPSLTTHCTFADAGSGPIERSIFEQTNGSYAFIVNQVGGIIRDLEIRHNAPADTASLFPESLTGTIWDNVLAHNSGASSVVSGVFRRGAHTHCTLGANIQPNFRGFGTEAQENCVGFRNGGSFDVFESGYVDSGGNASSDTSGSVGLQGVTLAACYTDAPNGDYSIVAAGPLDGAGTGGADIGYLGRVPFVSANVTPTTITDVNGATNTVIPTAAGVDVNYSQPYGVAADGDGVIQSDDGVTTVPQTVNAVIDADTDSIDIVQGNQKFGSVTLTANPSGTPITKSLVLTPVAGNASVTLTSIEASSVATTPLSDNIAPVVGDQFEYSTATSTGGTAALGVDNTWSVTGTLPATIQVRRNATATNLWFPVLIGGVAQYETVWLFQANSPSLHLDLPAGTFVSGTGAGTVDATIAPSVGAGTVFYAIVSSAGAVPTEAELLASTAVGSVSDGSLSLTAAGSQLLFDELDSSGWPDDTYNLYAVQQVGADESTVVTTVGSYVKTSSNVMTISAVNKGLVTVNFTQDYDLVSLTADGIAQTGMVVVTPLRDFTFVYQRGTNPAHQLNVNLTWVPTKA